MFDLLQEQFYKANLPVAIQNLLIMAVPVVAGLVMRFIVLWQIHRATRKTEDYSFTRSIIQYLNKPLNVLLVLFFIKIALPELILSPSWFNRTDKILDIIFIICYAWLLINCVKIAKEYASYKYDYSKVRDNIHERKVRTQLLIIQRIVSGAIVFIAIAFILLSFEGVKTVGAGMLTGVSIGGIIIGFAAQRPLSNIMSGLHIAFTQPIRIDDVVIIEKEFGNVEEITLSYVVLRLWDNRRLIVPINYFIEKPFENWTLNSAELLAWVMLYTDYSVPISAIRDELNRILPSCTSWNKKVNVVHVTDANDRYMEVRLLMSADNAGNASDLKNFIREHMLQFISTNYPGSLPYTRVNVNQV